MAPAPPRGTGDPAWWGLPQGGSTGRGRKQLTHSGAHIIHTRTSSHTYPPAHTHMEIRAHTHTRGRGRTRSVCRAWAAGIRRRTAARPLCPHDTACACSEGKAAPGPLTRPRPSPALTPAEGYRVTGQAQSRAFPRSGQARPHAGGDRGPLRAGRNAGPLPGRPRRGAAAGPGRRCAQLLRRGPAHLLPGDTSAFSATPRTRR